MHANVSSVASTAAGGIGETFEVRVVYVMLLNPTPV
jgi:hypothetical protein